MSAAEVLRLAVARCAADAKAEHDEFGVLPPCRSLDPLWPPLSLAEYEMMERDTAKYLLYHAALNAAAKSVAAATGGAVAPPLRAVVVGGGGGRLVQSALAACQEHGGPGSAVLVLDANPLAVEMLRQRFAAFAPPPGPGGMQAAAPPLPVTVTVGTPFTLLPVYAAAGPAGRTRAPLPAAAAPFAGQCDLAVAELLGSFGDNEFLPELMAAMATVFLKPAPARTALIPSDWVNWVVPISCPSVRRYLGLLKKPLNAGYVVGFPPDAVALSPPVELYRGDCRIAGSCYSGTVQVAAAAGGVLGGLDGSTDRAGGRAAKRAKAADAEAAKDAGVGGGRVPALRCDGWLGYFTSTLFGELVLDTRHGSAGRNSFHWEAFLFPAHAPLPCQPADLLRLELRRHCAGATAAEAAASDVAGGGAGPGRGVAGWAGEAPQARLWYEWRTGSGSTLEGSPWQNADGVVQSLWLREAGTEACGAPPALDTPASDPLA